MKPESLIEKGRGQICPHCGKWVECNCTFKPDMSNNKSTVVVQEKEKKVIPNSLGFDMDDVSGLLEDY